VYAPLPVNCAIALRSVFVRGGLLDVGLAACPLRALFFRFLLLATRNQAAAESSCGTFVPKENGRRGFDPSALTTL